MAHLIQNLSGKMWKHKLLVCVAAVMMILPPAVAYASTVQTYRQSSNEVGGQWHTTSPEFANRDFDRVYHASGYDWGLAYCITNESNCTQYNFGNTNPFYYMGGAGASDSSAWCYNVDDNSGVGWTCQSTYP
jgi:hypothetical protein